MDFDVSYVLDSEQQFWDELEDLVSADPTTHSRIDNALRSYLHLTTKFQDEYLPSSEELFRCCHTLLRSPLFVHHKDYVRTQLIYSLLQDDEPSTLYVVSSFLLVDGQQDELAFEMMNKEGIFPRCLELVKQDRHDNPRLHGQLLKLLYEMSRMQKLSPSELGMVNDAFVENLFGIVEELSDDTNDPYHYTVIRVLLVLNEQYMVASTANATDPPPTNRVIKTLSRWHASYRTFGENIILLLNRETETSLQLLILKLLYLLFTTPSTYEYFYTNDLRVLLDVILRNLLDLPNELISLRHTYLRVLYPLLAHTQLCAPPWYKKKEVVKVLRVLKGNHAHWEPVDETTVRLVDRVERVEWLDVPEQGDAADDVNSSPALSDCNVAQKLLGMSLRLESSASAVSVLDMAAVKERPGVQTRSRKMESAENAEAAAQDQDLGSSVHSENGNDRVSHETSNSPGVDDLHSMIRKPPPLPIIIAPKRKLPPKTPPPRRTGVRSSIGSGNKQKSDG